MTSPISRSAAATKQALRVEMRAVRRAVTDPVERSRTIVEQLRSMSEVQRADTVMVFTPVAGEPDVRGLVANGGVLPEHEPDPASVDVVVVPGLAFTLRGDRLGQGGGWYDRFLAGLRPDAVTIGVGFREQVVDHLPVEPHDIRLHHLVTA